MSVLTQHTLAMEQNNHQFTESFLEELNQFFDSIKPGLLSQNLRRMLIDYLEYELKTGVPTYFDEFLFPLNCLFDLLDKAENEITLSKDQPNATLNQNSFSNLSVEQKMIQFITTTIAPEKIYRISHKETHLENNFFDFLIVISDTSQISFKDYEQIISIAPVDNTNTQFSLHKSSYIKKQIAEGHVFYSIICVPDNIVYDNGNDSIQEANTESITEAIEKAKKTFYFSFNKAKSFLEGAKNYFQMNKKDIAAFMLHQATEIALRAIIISLSPYDLRTHSLRELLKNCRRYVPEIENIFSENKDEEKRLVSLLEKSYIEARYNDLFLINDSDLNLYFEEVQALHSKIEETFNSKYLHY